MAVLVSALGQDKSAEVVSTTARRLGITRASFSAADVHAVFDELVKLDGLVGVVARVAVSRGDVERLIARGSFAAPPQPISRPELRVGAAPAAAPSKRVPTFEITHLLAPALGVEKTREAIAAAAARRGVDIATGLSHAGALAVLDEMTNVEGIVGVVARFAKARFLLEPES